MLYANTAPQFTKMLQNLVQILDKGAEYAKGREFDVEILANARLAPDQFNFIRQIQITCDTAKLCCARLTGIDAPNFDDSEKTYAEIKTRVEKTISYLQTVTAKDFEGADEKHITQPRWEGKYLTGKEYAEQHAIPNFYFHMSTAYSILRHNGVPVGKKDYLGAMPYKK
jgi:uncharacterized protein